MEKTCIITNGNFCYTMKVDGKEINFQGSSSAEYFLSHYTALGYTVQYLDGTEFVSLDEFMKDI